MNRPARKTIVITGVVMVALLVSCGVSLALTRSDGPDPKDEAQSGQRAPAFSLPDLHDESRTVSLPTGRPTVVNFFASWCVPCEKELPLLRQAAADHVGEVSFVGVDHLDHRDDALAFVDRFGITYPTGYDPGGDTAPSYRLRGLPGTVFIRADGTIASVKHGEIKAAELADRLAELTLHGSAA